MKNNGEIPSFHLNFMDGVRANALERILRGVKYFPAGNRNFHRKRCIDFSSNDYLGFSMRRNLSKHLSGHTQIRSVVRRVKAISGRNDAYLELEEKAWPHGKALKANNHRLRIHGKLRRGGSSLSQRFIHLCRILNHAASTRAVTLTGKIPEIPPQ